MIFLRHPENYTFWVLKMHLSEVLLMSTHNICFCGEIEKFNDQYVLVKLEMCL